MAVVAVLGAGAWGTALACAIARAPVTVRLWGRDPAAMGRIAAARENATHLPGVALAPPIVVTADLSAALDAADVLVAAVPAQALGSLLAALQGQAPAGVPLVIAAKGLERSTGRFLSQVAADSLPSNPPAVLSGPSFAADVGRGRPTAVTLAAATLPEAARLGDLMGSPTFRLYHSDDRRGVEIGGAAKNVLAIACGIAHGRGLGASAGAALVARAFAELSRFGRRFGARPDTLAGLSGLGDLVLTCGSAQSRNFAFGEALGRGAAPSEDHRGVIEGVWTADVLVRLADAHGVDLPICRSVAAVLDGSLGIAESIERLMARPLKAE